MTTPDPEAHRPPRVRRRRLAALAAAVAVASGGLIASAPSASAAPVTIEGATIRWGLSTEVQSAPPFGGCNYLSAGASDGTEAQYRASEGDVAVVKNGAAPTWASKCTLTGGLANQEVVWSGGDGTVEPETGEAVLDFTGRLSVNFYGGLVPFTVENPTLTVDASGNGELVATLFGYGSSMEDPTVKVPLDPVPDVVVARLTGVDVDADGFTVTPDYAGVEYTPPAGSGGTPQNRTTPGWGAWPAGFVDFHYLTGLTSYWYTSGGAADPKKPPSAITVTYDAGDPGPDPDPEPGDDQQTVSVVVPEVTEPGEFLWSIDAEDRTVTLSEAANQGSYLQSTGAIKPVSVTDTRTGGPEWSISGQVSDFSGGLSGRYLGWSPEVLTAGAGAVPGAVVASGVDSGNGLTDPSLLAAAPGGHEGGSAALGADLDLRLPVDTEPGTYTATLTVTALS